MRCTLTIGLVVGTVGCLSLDGLTSDGTVKNGDDAGTTNSLDGGGTPTTGADADANTGDAADGSADGALLPLDAGSCTVTTVNALSIRSGGYNACALDPSGSLYCWGYNTHTQLGKTSETCATIGTRCSAIPLRHPAIAGAAEIAVSYGHLCARSQAGRVSCWGRNRQGQVGDGTLVSQPVPYDTGVTATELSLGETFTCAVLADRTVKCWGYNSQGQLAVDTSSPNLSVCDTAKCSPLPLTATGVANVEHIATGSEHACALRTDGSVLCWGRNTDYELGITTVANSAVPLVIGGLPDAKALASGASHLCIIGVDDAIYCWGQNSSSQLGTIASSSVSTPIKVTLPTNMPRPKALALGFIHSCALTEDGSVWCWGGNTNGQLGSGSTALSAAPQKIAGLSNVTAIASGHIHTCALSGTDVYCWGDAKGGQTNDPAFPPSTLSPRKVDIRCQ